MNLPSELINQIFMFMSSPTANLIKNEYVEYLTTYDLEYEEFYFSFSENYFFMYNSNKERNMPEFCRCHMSSNKCIYCYNLLQI